MLSNITPEEVRDHLVAEIAHARADWETAKKSDPVDDSNANRASGRLDGLMRTLRKLDHDEFDRQREERQKQVSAVLGVEDADGED
ncbi:hypothetical protein [Dietzia sp. Die43]|uniref:hypothetical protein n=1 Tax=Dietzia sp. Die43 TaxID=2926011 RepID=UPI0021198A19|nr:hypothetical protein [Dietzia sp. Die43]